jgi:hypothetical protein
MKRYKVRFTPEAEDDLVRLYDFLLERNVRVAGRALDAIRGPWSYCVSLRFPAASRSPTIRF